MARSKNKHHRTRMKLKQQVKARKKRQKSRLAAQKVKKVKKTSRKKEA